MLPRSYSIPLSIWSGSTSALVVPQKFGPGRLVTTLSTPGFTGLQSLPAAPPPVAAVPPGAALAAGAVVPPDAVVPPGAAVLLAAGVESSPHAVASRPTAMRPTINRDVFISDVSPVVHVLGGGGRVRHGSPGHQVGESGKSPFERRAPAAYPVGGLGCP